MGTNRQLRDLRIANNFRRDYWTASCLHCHRPGAFLHFPHADPLRPCRPRPMKSSGFVLEARERDLPNLMSAKTTLRVGASYFRPTRFVSRTRPAEINDQQPQPCCQTPRTPIAAPIQPHSLRSRLGHSPPCPRFSTPSSSPSWAQPPGLETTEGFIQTASLLAHAHNLSPRAMLP